MPAGSTNVPTRLQRHRTRRTISWRDLSPSFLLLRRAAPTKPYLHAVYAGGAIADPWQARAHFRSRTLRPSVEALLPRLIRRQHPPPRFSFSAEPGARKLLAQRSLQGALNSGGAAPESDCSTGPGEQAELSRTATWDWRRPADRVGSTCKSDSATDRVSLRRPARPARCK